jgi:regulatory protein SWI6
MFAAITTLLSETETEFTKEIDAKQAVIDKIHFQLRDCSRELGEQRRRLEGVQAEAKVRDMRKLKIANLIPAIEEERTRLAQLQQQLGQPSSDVQLKLGDADEDLAIPAGASPANILSNINPSPHQPLVLDQAQRQLLAATLPPAHVLRARVNAYKANNQQLEEGVKGLQSKSSELAAKYRSIISMCTGTEEKKVDSVLENLLRAVESENDIELARVREFLQRVGDVE